VPVAVMPVGLPDRAGALAELSKQWNAAGRKLWVVADSPETIKSVVPEAKVTTTPVVTNPFLLRRTLLHRPGNYAPEQFSFSLAPIPAG